MAQGGWRWVRGLWLAGRPLFQGRALLLTNTLGCGALMAVGDGARQSWEIRLRPGQSFDPRRSAWAPACTTGTCGWTASFPPPACVASRTSSRRSWWTSWWHRPCWASGTFWSPVRAGLERAGDPRVPCAAEGPGPVDISGGRREGRPGRRTRGRDKAALAPWRARRWRRAAAS
ncbi:mpv17-like protein 2 isoform 2-T2 [Thomomys bottae]